MTHEQTSALQPLFDKHTLGPWHVNAQTFENRITAFDGAHVCIVDSYCDDEVEGNKHLIAAAPELLEALEALLSYSAAEIGVPLDKVPLDGTGEMSKAKSAIAKARNGGAA